MGLNEKLLELQKTVVGVQKTSVNPFFNSRYFDINGILKVVKPILNDLGVIILQPLGNCKKESGVELIPCITTILIDVESKEEMRFQIAIGRVDDPQKFGSAITYYRRYSLQSLLSLEAVDDDSEMAMNRPVGGNDVEERFI